MSWKYREDRKYMKRTIDDMLSDKNSAVGSVKILTKAFYGIGICSTYAAKIHCRKV